MLAVTLEANEWGQVMAILSTAPWRDANPLLMKIGEQLRMQQQGNQTPQTPQQGQLDGKNGKEAAP